MNILQRPGPCPYCDGVTSDKLRCPGVPFSRATVFGRKYYECLFARTYWDAGVASKQGEAKAEVSNETATSSQTQPE